MSMPDPDAPPPTAAPAPPSGPTRPSPVDSLERLPRWLRRTTVAVLLVGAAAGLVLTVRAADTGEGSASELQPDAVERLIPDRGTEVPRQSPVGIDVASGHDAELIINDVVIPEGTDGLSKDLGSGLVRYVPGPGRPVEELLPESNCVVAVVWPQSEGRRGAESVRWCFGAS